MKTLLKIMVMGILVVCLTVPAVAKESDWQTYEVKEGDTLSEIVYFLHKSCGIKDMENFKARLIKWNPDLGIKIISPGQKIKFLPIDNKLISDVSKVIEENNKHQEVKINEKIEQTVDTIKQVSAKIDNKTANLAKGLEESKRAQNKLFLIILLSVGVILISGLVKHRQNRKNQTEKERLESPVTTPFTIGEKEYVYRPEIKDGSFVSLHKGNNGLIRFTKLSDLRRSVIRSLNDDLMLIKKELKAKRLIPTNTRG